MRAKDEEKAHKCKIYFTYPLYLHKGHGYGRFQKDLKKCNVTGDMMGKVREPWVSRLLKGDILLKRKPPKAKQEHTKPYSSAWVENMRSKEKNK